MRNHAAKYGACVVLACAAAVLVAVPVFGLTTTVTLVGAGDITNCSYTNDEATSKLLGSTLRSLTPDGNLPTLDQARVIAMGDNAYPRANRNQYANCYDNYNLDSSWSTFNPSRPDWWGNDEYLKRTMPVLGNHEYMNCVDDPSCVDSQPYFDYFSAKNGFQPPAAPVPNDPNDPVNNHGLTLGEGYYSYDLGSWHIVALNSNCDKVGGCDASSPQGQWLQQDLASPANTNKQCTLAYFHHPLYATGNGTNTLNVKPLWDMLYSRGADVILSGHAHRYELHAPMTPEGVLDPNNGIRQFVVGTGGEPGGSTIDYNQVPAGVLEKVIVDKFGIIKLDLDTGSYSWAFIAVDGTANGTVMDSGSEQCHGTPGSTGATPPTVTHVAPGNGASGVPPIGSKVEATFSQAMDATTINATTFTLTKPDGPDADTNPDPVSGTVTYDSTSNTATLTPSANLDYSTTFTATVKGGANGVKDAAGNPLSADFAWTFTTAGASQDTTPPETTIDSKPKALTNSTSASFNFSSNEAGSSFECKLDSGNFTSCTSPQSYSNLANGSHTFQVRAIDAAGNVDATPDSYSWTVDTTPPETTITTGPSGTVKSKDAKFTFSSTEANSTFQTRLDGGIWEPNDTATSKTYLNLANGTHTFEVKATDAAGNEDPTPASRTWKVRAR